MSRLRSAVLLFAREPVLGQVKTRLVPAIGPRRALSLYQVLLQRQINLVNSLHGIHRQCWIAGDIQHEVFRHFNGTRHQQVGEDLGERMYGALREALQNHDHAILIGCDCPDFDTAYIESAIQTLEQGVDVVYGPAADGGYALIGLRQPLSELFVDMDWGSDRVMSQNRAALETLGLVWHELPTVHDIDVPDDLVYLDSNLLQAWAELGE